MLKTIAAVAAVATVATASLPSDANAQWRRHGGGGAVAAGVIGGLAAGAIIGSALAPRYYYEPVPAYVEEPTCVGYQRVWVEGVGWRRMRVAVPCY